jgi:hypothetical protein
MKPEVLIKNWLMSWLRPEKLTEYNTQEKIRPEITEQNFNEFIRIFVDEKGDQDFTDNEKEVLKPIVTNKIQFGTGYPNNEKEAIRPGVVYLIEAGWQQLTKYPGANYWDGKANTHLVITGRAGGNTLNMSEPSLLLKMMTSLLIAGHNYFTFNHMQNPMITETLYGADEENSRQKGFAMRSLSMTYDKHRYGVKTNYGVIQNGQKK